MEGEYYHTKESVDEYIKLAEGHSGKNLIKKFINYLPTNALLLELGSGPGTDWKLLSSRYHVIGSDNSEEFVGRLRKEHPNAEFLLLDAISLETERRFDGIYSNKVLHHLKDQELTSSIQRQFEVLQPSGIICHSFWKGEGEEEFKGMYVNNHTEDEIERLFSPNFEVLLLKAYQEFETDDSLLLIAKKRDLNRE